MPVLDLDRRVTRLPVGCAAKARVRVRDWQTMVLVSTLAVYASGYLGIIFLSVCLAAGLYYLAELVEEYTRLAKKVIRYAIYSTLVLHALYLVWDRLPFLEVGVGVLAQGLYLRLLKQFPFIPVASMDFVGSVVVLLANHLLWMRYFYHADEYHSLEYILGFFLVSVWLVPFFYFISFASNDGVLPSSASPSGASEERKRQRSALLGMFNLAKKKREEILPKVPVLGDMGASTSNNVKLL
mmetsp:Transcript_7209/g.44863  ORF Transcript_7209/g.44863 Transcript_7209/m.44863 type:complete len:240 (+) Transcript_7209:2753-3472(+)